MTVTDEPQTDRVISYVQAFQETVAQCMREDESVFCAGEDIGAYGGVFSTFLGLQAEFGERRVVDTPISEQAIVGLGIGAAAAGLRPIVEHAEAFLVLSRKGFLRATTRWRGAR